MVRLRQDRQRGRGLVAGVLIAAAAGWLWSGPAAAQQLAQQTPEAPKKQGEGVQQQIEAQSQAATQGQQRIDPETLSNVTFQDILKNPDNAELNLAYAKKLVSEGRLGLAAATLERILLVNPGLDQVRLFYAVVLFRLDHLDEAESEFQVLQNRPLSEPQAAEVVKFLDLIAARKNPFQQSATFSAGVHVDTNRNAFPDNGNFLLLGAPFAPGGGRNRDVGTLAIASYDVNYDTGGQRWQQAFGNLSFVYDNQAEVDSLDLYAIVFDGGMLYRAPIADIIPGIEASYVSLNDDQYSRSLLGKLEVRRELIERRLDGFARVSAGYEKFHNTSTLPFNNEQNGTVAEVRLGGGWMFNPKTRLALEVGYKNKNANVRFESFQSYQVESSLTFALERGMFAIFNGEINLDVYDKPDPFIALRTRRDTQSSIGLTYGIPLGTIDDLFPFGKTDENGVSVPRSSDLWRSIVLSLTANYFHADSSVPNFQYRNFRFQALFTKRWKF